MLLGTSLLIDQAPLHWLLESASVQKDDVKGGLDPKELELALVSPLIPMRSTGLADP